MLNRMEWKKIPATLNVYVLSDDHYRYCCSVNSFICDCVHQGIAKTCCLFKFYLAPFRERLFFSFMVLTRLFCLLC